MSKTCIYIKKGRASKKEQVKVKLKLFFFLFFIDLTDNNMFTKTIPTTYLIMCAYVYIHMQKI